METIDFKMVLGGESTVTFTASSEDIFSTACSPLDSLQSCIQQFDPTVCSIP